MKNDDFQIMNSKIVGRVIFFMLIIMVVTHLIVFVAYSDLNNDDNKKVNKDLMVQQVLHLIQVVLTTPDKDRQSVITAVNVPNISISMTPEPAHSLVFREISLWDILEKITKQDERIHLSVRLQEGQWLNIQAMIVSRSWIIQMFLLSLEVMLALAVLFYFWSINRFTAPVKRFAQAAERLGKDLHSSALIEAGPPVVREAVRAMNTMQDRIRDMVRDRTLMLAAISHDLRTPITRLKLRAQFIEDDILRDKTINDLDEMGAMISEILSLSKEENSAQAQKTKVDLASLLAALCEDLDDVHNAVTYNGPQARLLVMGRSLSLKRAFNNLIENAVKYGHKAAVTLDDADPRYIYVIIEDEGDGIPEDEMEAVFSPFYRGDKSRSRATGGTGLGLAVTKDSINSHLGSIELANREEGGLRVTVKLPRQKG